MRFGPGWVGEYESLTPMFSCENYVHKLSNKNKSSSIRSFEDLKIVNNEKQPLFPLRNKPRIESDGFFHHQKDNIREKIAGFHTKEKNKSDVLGNVRGLNNFHADIASQQSYISDPTGSNSFRTASKENQISLDVDSRNSSIVNSYPFNKDIISKVGGLHDGQDGTCSINPKANGSSGFGSVPFGSINQKEEDSAKLIRMLPCNTYQNSHHTNTKQFMLPALPPRNNSSSSPSGTSSTHASWMPATTRSYAAHDCSKKALGNSEVQMRSHPSSTSKPTWMFPHSMHGFHEVDTRRAVIPQLGQKPSQMMSMKNISTVSFPQIITNELSRLSQGQTWQGGRGIVVSHSHAQPKQSKNMVAPDLNFGFQSPGSPGQQSSGISQQPDLALQL